MSDSFITKGVWVEGFTKLGVEAGQDYTLQNKGTGVLVVRFQDTPPLESDTEGLHVYSDQTLQIPRSITKIYLTALNFYSCKVTVEPYSYANINYGLVEDIYTSSKAGVRRISVDSQPTSFEANEQFRVFQRFLDVPNNVQILFKFSTVNALNIMERKINLWDGGREYLVVPDTGIYNDRDASLRPVNISKVNGNLLDSGLDEHPDSSVTVLYGVSNDSEQPFTPIPVDDKDQFPNGDAVKTSGGNKANSALLSNPNMSGVAEGLAFYLVFNGISSNTDTSGHFLLKWEERF